MKVKDTSAIRERLSEIDETLLTVHTDLSEIDGRKVRHEGSDFTTALVALKKASVALSKVRTSFEQRTDGLA